ncbi:MAG: 2-C-methyl-D-erythritol 2,4-cyclodiphosphate synthase [Clostridia bacterium]|nr:2-C-methyl-D-erythritol 2,4-cyclodiphosphate synthase [Clostridia bacterium]
MQGYRIGFGYDAHRLTAGRKLILGGVEIVHSQGLAGHSDADVLTHAIMDALLGAAKAGDLGKHFPDSDPQYKGISSLLLLEKVRELLQNRGYSLVNLDATIVAQAPKLADYRSQMEIKLAQALQAKPEQINIKATTTEGLGFTGQKEGMAAYAVVLLEVNSAR